ncbi:ribosome quality control complex subunit NEMF [Macrobrachium rosenbergii]|uniref:ribosome quality control complex subunit NEMF n=1 Tax=Macrobrachium rosenbergii TaxID=79674 RepID=UPI0034D55E72
MKSTFTTVDILAIVSELRKSVLGLRVIQVYDIDSKTYLIKLQKPDHKSVLLLESGSRIHTTEYEWPKSPAPSGFAMKLRKHLRNKRLENIQQLGVDRIIDLTFGSGEAEHHVILELYDRGNIVLTNNLYNILNILRPRKEGEDVRYAVHETYPVDRSRKAKTVPSIQDLKEVLSVSKENTPLKKILNPLLDCGGGVLDHNLLESGFPVGAKFGKHLKADDDLSQLHLAVSKAQSTVTQWDASAGFQGYIIKKVEGRKKGDGTIEEVHIYQEFIPLLFTQYKEHPHEKFDSFNKACDEFFSKMEAVKIDQKAMHQEREALKKLENVKKDHERRLQELMDNQKNNTLQGQLIELNKDLVDGAILVVRSAVANQIDWRQIEELLAEAQAQGDPVAQSIKQLKLKTNTIVLSLGDPFDREEDDMFLDSDEEREEGCESTKMRPMAVEIDLDLSAMANARKYFDQKRQAAKKEQKTISASEKALQSAEKKTRQTLKEVAAITNINKARKVHWFEKFLWFVSSENYLVIAGRDSQMNEMVVKRHLRPRDAYVHADLHGAASVIIKNPSGSDVPPKTLHEAGIMALCYSRAWDEKVVTSAWWVWGDQVSKTAPTGEYLTTGAFMVRGKKTFLPPSHLVYGFGFLFRLEEDSVARHAGERKIRTLENDDIKDSLRNFSISTEEEDIDIPLDDKDEDSSEMKSADESQTSLTTKEDKADTSKNSVDKESEEEMPESNDEQELVEYPDTVVEMTHIAGDQFALRPRTVSVTSQHSQHSEGADDKENIVFLGDNQPVMVNKPKSKETKQSKGKVKNKQNQENKEAKQNMQKEQLNEDGSKSSGAMKRGQRGKMKKMKKYRDQDEEEREMRMQLLQSAGSSKDTKKGSKGGKKSTDSESKGMRQPSNKGSNQKQSVQPKTDSKDLDALQIKQDIDKDEEDEDEEEAEKVADDLNIINALTALPVPEDELLYAIPICAPYAAMTNYKFKVKLTPGPGKKGKACKTALALFLGDKTITGREKDLLRAVRDQDLARNLPGKVKVSAPNITKIKK